MGGASNSSVGQAKLCGSFLSTGHSLDSLYKAMKLQVVTVIPGQVLVLQTLPSASAEIKMIKEPRVLNNSFEYAAQFNASCRKSAVLSEISKP